MAGHFIGPMPPQEFLERLMPVHKDPAELTADFNINFKPRRKERAQDATARFLENIATKAKEILGSKSCLVPFESCNLHFSGHAVYPNVRPDLSVAEKRSSRTRDSPDQPTDSEASLSGDDNAMDPEYVDSKRKRGRSKNKQRVKKTQCVPKEFCSFPELTLWGEGKRKRSYDAFDDDDPNSFESKTVNGRHTRNQLCAMYHTISQNQFRVRIFSLYFEEENCICRLLCWTPSGVIVSSRFGFDTVDSPLGGFFKRLSFMNRGERGWDDTIEPATAEEASLAAAAFEKPREERCVYTDGEDPTTPLEEPIPITDVDTTKFIRIGVPLDAEPGATQEFRYVIAERPKNSSPRNPIGRRTLCMEVYDPKTHRTLIIKDSWRTASLPAERDRLKTLNAAKVCNVPTFLFGGDIQHHRADLGEYFSSPWNHNRKENVFEDREHQRISTWEIGDALHRYTCSKDAVVAVRACIQGHEEAYAKSRLLHRDVSFGNVLLLRRRKNAGDEPYQSGLLIDWELAKHEDETEARQLFRTGTWLYMSIKVSSPKSRRPHNISDDLESFYWVLLYLFLRYGGFSPGLDGNVAKDALKELFYPEGSSPSSFSPKALLVSNELRPPLGSEFSFSPGHSLSTWMEARLQDLNNLYTRNRKLDLTVLRGHTIPPYEVAYEHLLFGFHALLLDSMNDLIADDWPLKDAAVNISPHSKHSDSFESQPVLHGCQPFVYGPHSSGTKRKSVFDEGNRSKKRLRSFCEGNATPP